MADSNCCHVQQLTAPTSPTRTSFRTSTLPVDLDRIDTFARAAAAALFLKPTHSKESTSSMCSPDSQRDSTSRVSSEQARINNFNLYQPLGAAALHNKTVVGLILQATALSSHYMHKRALPCSVVLRILADSFSTYGHARHQ